MSLKVIKNILSDNTADIFLFDEIGGDGINGSLIAEEINFLNEQGVDEIRIRINSPGGAVIDGLSIIGAIRASKAPVDTYVEGIAASIAGVIAQHGRKRFMNDFGRLMIHAPSFNEDGKEFLNDRDKEALAQIQDIIATIFQKNSENSKGDMLALMEREVWFDANLALNMGFIDEIISTDRQIIKFTENNISTIFNQYKGLLNNNKTELKMKDVKNYLKLEEAANDEQVLTAIKNNETALESLIDESNVVIESTKVEMTEKDTLIETLKTENEELKSKVKISEEKEIVNFIDASISNGKYKQEDKVSLLETATNDFTGFKKITNLIVVNAHSDITNEIVNSTIEKPELGLRDLEKNDPSKLEMIRNNSPELYNEMYKAQYNTEIK